MVLLALLTGCMQRVQHPGGSVLMTRDQLAHYRSAKGALEAKSPSCEDYWEVVERLSQAAAINGVSAYELLLKDADSKCETQAVEDDAYVDLLERKARALTRVILAFRRAGIEVRRVGEVGHRSTITGMGRIDVGATATRGTHRVLPDQSVDLRRKARAASERRRKYQSIYDRTVHEVPHWRSAAAAAVSELQQEAHSCDEAAAAAQLNEQWCNNATAHLSELLAGTFEGLAASTAEPPAGGFLGAWFSNCADTTRTEFEHRRCTQREKAFRSAAPSSLWASTVTEPLGRYDFERGEFSLSISGTVGNPGRLMRLVTGPMDWSPNRVAITDGKPRGSQSLVGDRVLARQDRRPLPMADIKAAEALRRADASVVVVSVWRIVGEWNRRGGDGYMYRGIEVELLGRQVRHPLTNEVLRSDPPAMAKELLSRLTQCSNVALPRLTGATILERLDYLSLRGSSLQEIFSDRAASEHEPAGKQVEDCAAVRKRLDTLKQLLNRKVRDQ